MYFGPAFQWVDELWRRPGQEDGSFEVLVHLLRPAAVGSLAGYVIHPGLLDGCFQAAGLAHQWATGTRARCICRLRWQAGTLLQVRLEKSGGAGWK